MSAANLTDEQWKMVDKLIDKDVNSLRLAHHGNAAMVAVIDQIECRQRTRKKLCRTLERIPEFLFPSVLSAEQSTSDSLARFHSTLIPVGARVLDAKASQVTALDLNGHTAECAAINFRQAGIYNACVMEGDSVSYLRNLPDNSFDCIFIDPARRGEAGQRLFALADCSPDVTSLLGEMLRVAETVIIKASPMLDISHSAAELHDVSRILAIGDRRECKELVIVCRRNYSGAPLVSAVTIAQDEEIVSGFDFRPEAEKDSEAAYGMPESGQWLYEPWPATIKAAPFKLLCNRYPVMKPAPNSHVYFSRTEISDFPGRGHRIDAVIPFNKKSLRALAEYGDRFDITTRNFPLGAEALAKKLKIKSGGNRRLFATRDSDNRSILIITSPTL